MESYPLVSARGQSLLVQIEAFFSTRVSNRDVLRGGEECLLSDHRFLRCPKLSGFSNVFQEFPYKALPLLMEVAAKLTLSSRCAFGSMASIKLFN